MARKQNFLQQVWHADNRQERIAQEIEKNRRRFRKMLGRPLYAQSSDYVVARFRNAAFLLDPTSLVDRVMLQSGSWEQKQLSLMNAAMQLDDQLNHAIFLDIGSYWGLYAIEAKAAGVGEVHAFEPDLRNRSQLHAQLFLNKLEAEITVHPFAAFNKNGTLPFAKSETCKDGNRGSARWAADNQAATNHVTCRRLDDVFDFRDRMIFCKLDVEGAELEALDGMKDLLRNNRVFLQVETFSDKRDLYRETICKFGFRFIENIHVDDYYQNF